MQIKTNARPSLVDCPCCGGFTHLCDCTPTEVRDAVLLRAEANDNPIVGYFDLDPASFGLNLEA